MLEIRIILILTSKQKLEDNVMNLSKKIRKISSVLLMAVMVFSLAACGSSKTEKVKKSDKYGGIIDTLCESKVNADVDEFMTMFGSMQSLMEQVVTQEVLDNTKNTYQESCGDKMTYSYEIKDEKQVSDDDKSSYQDTIEMFGETGTISEAYDVTVDVTVKGKKGSYDYEMNLSLGKVGDKWMIVNFNDTLLK